MQRDHNRTSTAATERRNEVTANVNLIHNWATVSYPDPRLEVKALLAEDDAFRAREAEIREEFRSLRDSDIYQTINDLSARFGSVRPLDAEVSADTTSSVHTGDSDARRTSRTGWTWYDARFMIATAIGAPRPEWDGTTESWWMDREHGNPVDASMTPAEVAATPIPDWANLPQVHEMLESRERWLTAFPGDHPEYPNLKRLQVPAGESKQYIGFPSFVDLGIFLLGTTDFLAELAMETDLVETLMEKSFELSTSYLEFLHSLNPVQMELLLGFAGDTACLLSPRTYEKYSVRWDERLFSYAQRRYGCADDFPCNLHSCGPSGHLYDSWGDHPHQEHIVVLQTRLVPGTVENLRRNMPDTVLQLTLHPQHFDVATCSPEELKQVVLESADHAGGRNVHFTVFAVANSHNDVPVIDANLKAMADTLEELNS